MQKGKYSSFPNESAENHKVLNGLGRKVDCNSENDLLQQIPSHAGWPQDLMLCRCIHDEFDGFKQKVNTTIYQVGRKFLPGIPGDGCVGSFVETPVVSVYFNFPSTSTGKGRRNDSLLKIRKSKRKVNTLSRRILEASLETQISYSRVAHLIQNIYIYIYYNY